MSSPDPVSAFRVSSFVIEIKGLASEIQDFFLALAKQGKPFKAHGS